MLQDRVSGCTFTRCKHPDCFPILHVRKYTLRVYFWCLVVSMLRTGCYVKRMESIQFFKRSSVIYTRVQVNSGTIANSCWLIQTYKYQCCRFQVHFISIFSVWFEAPKRLLSKCLQYVMGNIINSGSMFWPFSLVLHLEYIDYSLCQTWSVYIQYLRCCDHSNKWLFLFIQQADVLPNCF